LRIPLQHRCDLPRRLPGLSFNFHAVLCRFSDREAENIEFRPSTRTFGAFRPPKAAVRRLGQLKNGLGQAILVLQQ
jgi:hypothetical protein